ncbi:putative reverse transcriptase domain-containing protein, partial [Tanacetum coccineum]
IVEVYVAVWDCFSAPISALKNETLNAEIDLKGGCSSVFRRNKRRPENKVTKDEQTAVTSNIWIVKSPVLDNSFSLFDMDTVQKPRIDMVRIPGKEMTKYLNDFQFGVGVSGGTEAVLHSVNRVLSARHSDGSLAMLTVDFSNAFNLVDRASLLHEHIWSTTGVQQGDPLGPLLFALVLHPLVHKIRDNFKLLLHAWYLDDGTVIGDSEDVAKDWTFYGVKLLGGAVSIDASFISRLAMKRAAGAVDLMRLPPQLCDPQSELLLLRSCMGIAKLFFGLRTCRPVYMEEATLLYDKGLRQSIEDMVVCGGSFFGDIQWRLASLPIRFGGLGLYSATEASSYAFVASRAQPWALQDHILRDSSVCDIDSDYVCALACLCDMIPSFDSSVDYDMTVRQKAVFECLQAPHAQDFLLPIPIDGLGQHMSLVEYRIILKYRLMIPLFPVDEACPVCREACPVCHKACLDSFGEHAVHCRELSGFKYRHDMVRDVLVDIFRPAGISVKKEAPVNFLTDPSEGRSTLRPDDILIFGWVGGKHACVNLTVVSPFVGLGSGCFTVGQAALKAASFKNGVYEKEPKCTDYWGRVRKQPPIVENIELENKFHEPAMQEVVLAEVGKALESILPNIYSQMKREVRGMVIVEVDATMTAREVNRQQENMVLIVSNYRIVLLRISVPARLLRRSQTCG